MASQRKRSAIGSSSPRWRPRLIGAVRRAMDTRGQIRRYRVQVHLRDAVVKIFSRIPDFVVISNLTARILYIDESFNFSCSDSEWNWRG
jgi:hypothetical protein